MSDRPDHLNVELHGDTIAQLRETKRQGPIVLTYTDLALERRIDGTTHGLVRAAPQPARAVCPEGRNLAC